VGSQLQLNLAKGLGGSMKTRALPSSLVTEAIIEEITRKIVKTFQPERIILFGSHAYGKPGRDSDMDLLVIMDTEARPAERSTRIAQVCRPRYVAMDILVRTPEEIEKRLEGFDPFLEEILSRGRVLYDAAG
jgi:predicted nucleotidyltransferase